MDADDLCDPERLRLSLAKLEAENCGMVASALALSTPPDRRCRGSGPAHAVNDHWGALLERNWIGTPSVMLRREVLDSGGLFPTKGSIFMPRITICGFVSAVPIPSRLYRFAAHPVPAAWRPIRAAASILINTSSCVALQKVGRMEARAGVQSPLQ